MKVLKSQGDCFVLLFLYETSVGKIIPRLSSTWKLPSCCRSYNMPVSLCQGIYIIYVGIYICRYIYVYVFICIFRILFFDHVWPDN